MLLESCKVSWACPVVTVGHRVLTASYTDTASTLHVKVSGLLFSSALKLMVVDFLASNKSTSHCVDVCINVAFEAG